MRSFSIALFALIVFAGSSERLSLAQIRSSVPGSSIALHASSSMYVASEMGGAFMSPSKCDADGNLYIRKYAMDRPMLGPVGEMHWDGKRMRLFNPSSFSQLALY